MRTALQRSAFLVVLTAVALAPRSAAAVQAHGGAEGLVAHELGHALFAGGLLYVLFAGSAARWGPSGRRAYQGFLLLVIAWNALTFTGHLLQHSHPNVHTFVARDGWDCICYLSHLDHLLLIPGLVLLLVALHRWRQSEEKAP